MSVISTFELLAKPQLPPGIPGPIANLGRNVIQGYFLTIANTSTSDLVLSIVFTARLSGVSDLSGIVPFLDTSGTNIAGTLEPTFIANKFRYSPLFLPAQATGLLIVQPSPPKVSSLDFEVRGYVEIFLSSLSGTLSGIPLQISAEQRGTFFADATAASLVDRGLDQIAYSLSVPDGGRIVLSS
jgi:hypothetical protein